MRLCCLIESCREVEPSPQNSTPMPMSLLKKKKIQVNTRIHKPPLPNPLPIDNIQDPNKLVILETGQVYAQNVRLQFLLHILHKHM